MKKKSRTRPVQPRSKARAHAGPRALSPNAITGRVKARLRLFQSHMTQYLRAKAALDRDAPRRAAALAFKNSEKLNAAALADPASISRYVAARVAAHPEVLGRGFAKAEHRVVDRATLAADIARIFGHRVVIPSPGPPTILTLQDPACVSMATASSNPRTDPLVIPFTVTGENFSDCHIRLRTDDGTDLHPEVISRSDTAITLWIPRKGGVRFHTRATLGLVRFDPKPRTAYVGVTVEPVFRLWASEWVFSDEGHNLTGYEEDLYSGSLWLPPHCALARLPWCQAPGLFVQLYNKPTTTIGGIDVTGDAEIKSIVGPFVIPESILPGQPGDRRCLGAHVKVEGDNLYQNLILSSDFYICVPLGWPSAGWRSFGDFEEPSLSVADYVGDVLGDPPGA